MSPPPFVELAAATNFSFLHGASHAEEMVGQAARLRLSGLGVCDKNSLAGIVRAHAAAKEAGLGFAVGCRLVFSDATPELFAWPTDRAAYGRLCRLLTVGNMRGEKGDCRLLRNDLAAHSAGLVFAVVAGTAPDAEIAATAALLATATDEPVRLAITAGYGRADRRRQAETARLAERLGLPLLATLLPLYHVPDRRILQDTLTAIAAHVPVDAAGRRLQANAERHIKPPEEVARLFREYPDAVRETVKVFDRLAFSLDELRYEYPEEVTDPGSTPQETLVRLTREGARARYPDGVPEKVRTAIAHELQLIGELDYAPYFLTVHDIVRFARSRAILAQGRGSAANSAVCFCLGITEVDPDRTDLLFERFISAERREPPDIDVDFEHERREEVIQYVYAKYGRDRAGLAATVISYRSRSAAREIGKALGLSEDAVSALSGTIWGWSAAGVSPEDARRAGLAPDDPRIAHLVRLSREIMGFPRHLSQHVGGFVITRGRLDEVVPITKAAMEDRTMVEWDKDDLDALGILKIDVLALGMLTCIRKAFALLGRHYADELAASDAAAPSAYPRFHPMGDGGPDWVDAPQSPLITAQAGIQDHTSQHQPEAGKSGFPAHWVGAGPAAPSIAVDPRNVPQPPPVPAKAGIQGGSDMTAPWPVTLASIPEGDTAVYDMICRADTLGVFQIESRAQMTMLPRLKPREFYDLVIEVAIVRPGPIQGDMVHPYLRRRQKKEKVHYPAPSPEHGPPDELKQVLGKTLGVPLFQEQAMKIAIVAAGFTPSEADRLRRAMATFRKVGTIHTFQEKMVEGMARRGYDRAFAERCFQQIEGFGEYGFPESHAASFALLVYASCWLKCHYPDVFCVALLNSQPMGFYAPSQIVRDAARHGVEIRPACVNASAWDSTLEPGPAARDRLHRDHASMRGAIRARCAVRLGLRQVKGLAEAAVETLVAARGAGYDSVRDLWLRTGLPRPVIERLAEADAFAGLGLSRRDALWAARGLDEGAAAETLPLFAAADTAALRDEPDAHLPPMPPGEEVIHDYRTLSLSLKAHPAAFVRARLTADGVLAAERLAATANGGRVTVAGLVLVRQRPGSAKGVIFMTLEDETSVANVIVWPKVFERFRAVVLGSRFVQVTGRLQCQDGVIHVVADRLVDRTADLSILSEDAAATPRHQRGGPFAEMEGMLANADEVRRPQDDVRTKIKPGSTLARLMSEMPELEGDLDPLRRRNAETLSKAAPSDDPQPAPRSTWFTPRRAASDTSEIGRHAEDRAKARATRTALPKGRNFH
ncbi:error-prone DNA polymerase [Amorphus orientalis]|uniref:Error-prone DNA polymerase n=1 Tax=Amorphus orientalis TaxID=649198 RepID=A0AAE4AST9_9HYPH|nr:OB-fold nucleic acid binding domain-containing protein [Amorphus orientalis]MDQ0316631.1 error-prone DNA polymerase [Amorphus orientalis]